MLITKSNNTELGTRKRTLFRSLSLGPTSVKLVGVVLLALLSLFYLAQQTQSATRNYAIQDLESKKKTIESAKEDMSLEALRLKSLQEVQNKAKELGLASE
jgi:cell division protein FtsL